MYRLIMRCLDWSWKVKSWGLRTRIRTRDRDKVEVLMIDL